MIAALAGIGYGIKLEQDAVAARDAAVADGITQSARVLGSLTSKQERTRVRFTVESVEHVLSVFPDRAYYEGLTIDVAYLPDNPRRLYIVGARPWNWWTAMRRFFVVAAVLAGVVSIGAALFVHPTRTSSV
ncbi:MAG TPA: hypothetical protein VEW90_04210 [Gaiellaceae bacterium]|nr:hypothetical protein [Gaiellaceae bacterium]